MGGYLEGREEGLEIYFWIPWHAWLYPANMRSLLGNLVFDSKFPW